MKEPYIKIDIDSSEMDSAIEKANQLLELLMKAQQIIDSLSSVKLDANKMAAEFNHQFHKYFQEG